MTSIAEERRIEAQEEFDFNATKKILGAWLPTNNVEIKRFDKHAQYTNTDAGAILFYKGKEHVVEYEIKSRHKEAGTLERFPYSELSIRKILKIKRYLEENNKDANLRYIQIYTNEDKSKVEAVFLFNLDWLKGHITIKNWKQPQNNFEWEHPNDFDIERFSIDNNSGLPFIEQSNTHNQEKPHFTYMICKKTQYKLDSKHINELILNIPLQNARMIYLDSSVRSKYEFLLKGKTQNKYNPNFFEAF